VSKCNGLVREKELEPWVGDGTTTEDGLEAIDNTVVDGFDKNEVMSMCILLQCRMALHTLLWWRHSNSIGSGNFEGARTP